MIKVTDKFYIKVDYCYTVYEKNIGQSGKSKGEDVFVNATYHGSMVEALQNIIHRIQISKLKSDDIITLKEAIKILVDTKQEFIDIVKDVENYK